MPFFANVKLSTNPIYRGWTYVVIGGLVLAVVALVDRGGLQDAEAATGAAVIGVTDCQLTVRAERVNVRAAPDENSELLDTLTSGTLLDATPTVTGDFRELADGRWVADRFLDPVPGTTCS